MNGQTLRRYRKTCPHFRRGLCVHSYLFNVRGRAYYHIGTGSCFRGLLSLSRLAPMSKRAGAQLPCNRSRLLADTAVRELSGKTETRPNEQGSDADRHSSRCNSRKTTFQSAEVNHRGRTTFHFIPVPLCVPYYLKAHAVGLPAYALVNDSGDKTPQTRPFKELCRNLRACPKAVPHRRIDHACPP